MEDVERGVRRRRGCNRKEGVDGMIQRGMEERRDSEREGKVVAKVKDVS